MTRKKSTEQFIAEARAIHGNRYDYTRANYINNKTKTTIICPKHGEWQQTPANHLSGFGCKLCGHKNAGQYHKKDTHSFIEAARKVHGNKYDYSEAKYVGAREKLTILCPIHGAFKQFAGSHLGGKGCTPCSYEYRSEIGRMQYADFVCRATEVHKAVYNYELAKDCFGNSDTKIPIICSRHGVFEQSPANHLRGNGCPICRYEKSASTMRKSTEDFILAARAIHGEAYDYSTTDYNGAFKLVTIICPIDGTFRQSPTSHLGGTGCPRCSRRAQGAPRNLVRALRGEFDSQVDAFVYIVRFRLPATEVPLFKVGSGSGTRLRTVLSSIRQIGATVEDVHSRSFKTTGEAIVFEHIAHDQIMDHKFPVPAKFKFAGYSEVFTVEPELAAVDDHPTIVRFRSGERWDPRTG